MEANLSNRTPLLPPSHLAGDFIQIGYLSAVILVGIPLNAFIAHRMTGELRKCRRNNAKTAFLLLKLNLNVSDFLILFSHALGTACWLATYEWLGGSFLCKLFQFLSMFSYYSNTNVVVCIGLDRFKTVVLKAAQVRENIVQEVKILLTLAWLLATVCSMPQWFVWDVLNVYPGLEGGWYQCSDIWTITMFEQGREAVERKSQYIYEIFHLILVFWGPMLILLISYLLIACKMLQYSFSQTAGLHFQESQKSQTSRVSFKYQKRRWTQHDAPPDLNGNDCELVRMNEYGALDTQPQQKEPVAPRLSSRSWRSRLRTRIASTLLVVLVHILLWLPYNVVAITKYVSPKTFVTLSTHINVMASMIVLNSVINPFLYGFHS